MNWGCVVFGASGEIGQNVVQCALERGIKVTAVVRAPCAALEALLNENAHLLTISQGDICSDAKFVSSCIANQRIVFSCLGVKIAGLAVWHQPSNPDYLAQASWNIRMAMLQHNVQKISLVSPIGAGDSWQQLTFEMQCFLSLTAIGHVLPLMTEVEQIFLDVKLDVSIVRPSGMTRGPLTRRMESVSTLLEGSTSMSRWDVAYWMVQQACNEDPFPLHSVYLSNNTAAVVRPIKPM